VRLKLAGGGWGCTPFVVYGNSTPSKMEGEDGGKEGQEGGSLVKRSWRGGRCKGERVENGCVESRGRKERGRQLKGTWRGWSLGCGGRGGWVVSGGGPIGGVRGEGRKWEERVRRAEEGGGGGGGGGGKGG